MDSDDLSEMETAFPTPDASMFDDRIEKKTTDLYETANVSYEQLDLFMDLFSSNSLPLDKETSILCFQSLFSDDVSLMDSPNISDLLAIVLEYMILYKSEESAAMTHAAWILTNLACVSHEVADEGAVNVLVGVIRETPSIEVKNQCIWAIGNIALDCTECLAMCRSTDILELLGDILENEEFTSLTHMKTVIRTLLSIIIEPIKIDPITCKQLVKGCHKVLMNFERNREIISDTIDCLTALAYSGSQIIFEQPGLIDKVLEVSMINNNGHDYQVRYLFFLCNLLKKCREKIVIVAAHPGFFTVIKKITMSQRVLVRRLAVWALMNLSFNHIQYFNNLISDSDVFAIILREACDHTHHIMMKDAYSSLLWTVIRDCETDRFSWYLGAGILNAFPHLVCSRDVVYVQDILRALLIILERRPHYIGLFDKLRVVDKINARALERRRLVREVKEELEQMIDSNKTTKEPYTFKFCPRENRGSEAQL